MPHSAKIQVQNTRIMAGIGSNERYLTTGVENKTLFGDRFGDGNRKVAFLTG
jgi:hypothetical protein